MYIKYIILEGFKSYKEKTVLGPLDQGQNTLLGKNGAGKSNFFCAVELIFSEKYFNLNSKQRSSFIHNCQESRSLKAIVEIIFDNSDRRFPVEKDEFSVKRMVGMKEDCILIDHKKVTRAELRNLLATAGFRSENPYNIVRQGQISLFSTASDATRLDIVKKIAGDSSFETRDPKISENLASVNRTLKGIEEEIGELEKKSEELNQERKALKDFNNLNNKKKCLEFALFSKELEEIREKKKAFEMRHLNGDINNLKDVTADLQEIKDGLKELGMEVDQLKSSLDVTQESKDQEEKKMERLSHEMVRLKLSIKDIQETQSQDISGELEDAKNELNTGVSMVDKMREEAADLVQEVEGISLNIDTKQKRSNWIRTKTTHGDQFKTRKDRDTWLFNQIKEEKTNLTNLETGLAELREAEENIKTELTQIDSVHQEKKEEIRDIKSRIEGDQDKKMDLENEKANTMSQFLSLEGSVRNGNFEQDRLEQLTTARWREIASTRAEINSISAAQTIEEVVDGADERIQDGYYGMVASLLDCDENLYTVVHGIGGMKMYHHVVSTKDVANYIIKECNRRGLKGEFNFLPLDQLRPKKLGEFQNTKHAILLLPKLRFREEYMACMKFLFGSWVLCKNTDVAVEVSRKYKGYNFITTDGDKVESKGVMVGGTRRPNNMFKRFHQYTTSLDELNEQREKLKEDKENFIKLDQERRSIETELEKIENRSSRNSHTVERLQSDLRLLVERRNGLKEQESRDLISLRKKLSEMESSKTRISELEAELRVEMKSRLSTAERSELENLDKELKVLNKKFKSLSSKLNIQNMQIQDAVNDVELKLKRRVDELKDRKEGSTSRQIELGNLNSALSITILQRNACKIALGDLKETELKQIADLQARNVEVEKMEGQKVRLNEQKEKISAKLSRFEEEKLGFEKRKMGLEKSILELGAVKDFKKRYMESSKKTLLSAIKTINEQLNGMENINHRCDYDYTMVEENKAWMEGQLESILEEFEATKQTHQMLKEKRVEQISFTFTQVQKYFEELFKIVVPNGHGELLIKVPDGEDHSIENATGLEIKVSFTKSKGHLKNLSSLSGGQKATISLIFILAIQKCDPAPFYLFDEVDAALDAEHRTAIAKLVRAQASSAQFVCTTFRSELAEESDMYFGVMIRNNVSKVKQINKDDAQQFLKGLERQN